MQVVKSKSNERGKFLYSVKIINPQKKSEYVVQKLRSSSIFESIEDMKQELSIVQGIPSTIDQLGYIEPGHGIKGKQRWLSSSEDLKDMYIVNKGREEILLWCSGPKQPLSMLS